MLVLSRNVGQTLLIGNDIELHIVAIHKQQVRVAISAPKTIKILRKELLRESKSDSTSNSS